jgi:GDP-4-dehydro-6-deoxy-D-mannose reductase
LRVLITGASGFAGGWLTRACADAGDEVIGLSRRGELPKGCAMGLAIDLVDQGAVRAAVRETQPEVVYHLAALSSVGLSWEDPVRTVNENVAASVSVLEALRLESSGTRVVWVSSCQVYGSPERSPVDETGALEPENPYAVSKVAGDLLAGVYAEARGLDIVRARPFNHAGPGQRSLFIVSSLARQAAEGRIAGLEEIEIVTGNPDTRRDFTDVRDVVHAYRLLAAQSAPGVFNVSSGRSVSAAELVGLIQDVVAPARVRHVVDPSRVRAHEVQDLCGSHERLSAATGWEPSIPLEQTLHDAVSWWERELTPGRVA